MTRIGPQATPSTIPTPPPDDAPPSGGLSSASSSTSASDGVTAGPRAPGPGVPLLDVPDPGSASASVLRQASPLLDVSAALVATDTQSASGSSSSSDTVHSSADASGSESVPTDESASSLPSSSSHGTASSASSHHGAPIADDGIPPPPPGGPPLPPGGPAANDGSTGWRIARVAFNGVREMGAQLGGRYVASLAIHACAEAMKPHLGDAGTAAVLAVTSAVVGTAMHFALNQRAEVPVERFLDRFYQADGKLTSVLRIAALAAPLALPGIAAAWGADSAASVAEALLTNQVARASRQVVQSFSMSDANRGIELRRMVGGNLVPLAKDELIRVNTVRDLLYCASSLALLYGAGNHQVAKDLTKMAEGISKTFCAPLAKAVWGALNEGMDGINPDLAKALYLNIPRLQTTDDIRAGGRLAVTDAGTPFAQADDISTHLMARATHVLDNTPLRITLGTGGSDVLGSLTSLFQAPGSGVPTGVAEVMAAISTELGALMTGPRARILTELQELQKTPADRKATEGLLAEGSQAVKHVAIAAAQGTRDGLVQLGEAMRDYEWAVRIPPPELPV